MGVRAVSGHATLSSFTINHRFSLPGLPAPYVVAQVAIVEDPARSADHQHRRLRSRAARDRSVDGGGVRAHRGRLASAVPAGRRAHDDTPQATDEIAPERFGEHITTVVIRTSSRNGCADRDRPSESADDWWAAAAADRGRLRGGGGGRRPSFDDIDGLSTYPSRGGFVRSPRAGSPPQVGAGIRPTWNNGGSTPSGRADRCRRHARGRGRARPYVLCFRTVWEATHGELMKQGKIPP